MTSLQTANGFPVDMASKLAEVLGELVTMEQIVDITAEHGLGEGGRGMFPQYCRREVEKAKIAYVKIGTTHYYYRPAVVSWASDRAKRKEAQKATKK